MMWYSEIWFWLNHIHLNDLLNIWVSNNLSADVNCIWTLYIHLCLSLNDYTVNTHLDSYIRFPFTVTLIHITHFVPSKVHHPSLGDNCYYVFTSMLVKQHGHCQMIQKYMQKTSQTRKNWYATQTFSVGFEFLVKAIYWKGCQTSCWMAWQSVMALTISGPACLSNTLMAA